MRSKSMNKTKIYFQVILLALLVVLIAPFTAEAKKWSYKAWAERKQERDAHFSSLASRRPNVFRDYVYNVSKANGVVNTDAYTKSIKELTSKKVTEVSTTDPNYYYNNSTVARGNIFLNVTGTGVGETFVSAKSGQYISFTAAAGKAYFCVGWGCSTSIKVKGTGGGTCTAKGPSGKLNLKTPKNKSTVILENGKVTLNWNGINNFGTCCSGSCVKRYYVYLGQKGKSLQKAAELGTGKLSFTTSLAPNKTYEWYIIGINSETGAVRSDTWEFTVLPGTQTVNGVIWDSTDRACNVNHEDYEIKKADINGDISVTIAGLTGNWQPDNSGSSYEVTEVPYGDGQIICANIPEPTDMPNFRYVMECAGNNKNGVVSKSCATVDVAGPTTRDLGFRLDSKGWFTSIAGDVYGGCTECADAISLGLPINPLGGFANYLIDSVGSVFSRSDMSVKDADGNDHYSANNEYNAEFVSSNFWPKTMQFSSSAHSQSITGSVCENIFNGVLDAGKSYGLTRECLQKGIDNLSGDYEVDGDGFAVLFVEADGTSIDIDKEIKSQNDNRILIVSEEVIDITSEIGYDSPTSSSSPNIELGLISEQSINFNSGGDNDTTIIVEGPIVTKNGVINFNRDRGLSNAYPAEVVVYNPLYLTAFELEEHPGLGIVNILWTSGF